MIRIGKEYKRIEKEGSCEYEVQKSSFIGYGAPISDEKEAQKLIDNVKSTYPDGNHHVYAYILGRDFEVQKFSDDGEPSGTAGKPVLEIMKREGLVNSLIIITRFFGGIKLGAGGLIRAYARSAKNVIENNRIITMKLYQLWDLRFDYQYWGKVENQLRNHSIFKLKTVNYEQKVHCQVYIPPEKVTKANKIFMDLTEGQGNMKENSQEYIKED